MVSLVSSLWALAERRDQRAVDVGVTDLEDQEESERRRAAAEDRAERKLHRAEAREARLAGRTTQAEKEGPGDGAARGRR